MEKRGLLTADLFRGGENGGVIVKRNLLAQRIGQASEQGETQRPLAEFIICPSIEEPVARD